MITRHFLTIPGSGRRVHYRRAGSGPLLLMVHQSPRSSAEYERLMSEWSAHFTCVAPDTPGFGQSDPLPGEPEIADFAAALDEFVMALGATRCAAYGFHSGGIILVNALQRFPERFSCLAIGGYAVWTAAEMRVFGEHYLPPFRPQPYGEHLTWLWNRMLEQSWYFPWFDVRDAARLPGAHADIAKVHAAVMEMLDAGDAYRAGYGAVLRAPREIPPPGSRTPPVLITAYEGDPLHAHLARLGTMPSTWSAHGVATPAEHEAASLAFLLDHADDPAPPIAEDEDEGFVVAGGGLIHWKGEKRAARMVLHAPGAELADLRAGTVAIDVPGHGLSSPTAELGRAIEAACAALDAHEVVWPQPATGDPTLLYPDFSPDRFGAHLTRAWGMARAGALFSPWYAADSAHALAIDAAALEPEAIARRARALLRAGAAAPTYHAYLESRTGETR